MDPLCTSSPKYPKGTEPFQLCDLSNHDLKQVIAYLQRAMLLLCLVTNSRNILSEDQYLPYLEGCKVWKALVRERSKLIIAGGAIFFIRIYRRSLLTEDTSVKILLSFSCLSYEVKFLSHD